MPADWWHEMARLATEAGHDPFSVAWYTSMRDQYVAAFPNADQRSLENMNSFIDWAARHDPVVQIAEREIGNAHREAANRWLGISG